ncbi:MAG: hypothetical protein WA090_04785 [Candidatus Nanopelagicaceae bacterium]
MIGKHMKPQLSESPALSLALSISSCAEVCKALQDGSHDCHEVVNWQAGQWAPKIDSLVGSPMHRPEAWTGDLERAPIIFLSSNPSFDAMENFPSWDTKSWSDEDISDFGANRFSNDAGRRFGATDGPRLVDADKTIGKDGNLSGQVKHWRWVRSFAAMVLNKPIADTSAISDFVMTELVHCKSPHEEGVIQAMETCKEKWLDQILKISPARLIFVAGAKTGMDFARMYPDDLPATWGKWANDKNGKGKGFWPKSAEELKAAKSSGAWDFDPHQKLNSHSMSIAGMNRTVIYISRPSPGGPIYAPWNHPDLVDPLLLDYWRSKIGF